MDYDSSDDDTGKAPWNNKIPETLSAAEFEKRKRKFKKNKKYRKELIREEKMNTTKMETNIVEMRTGEQDIVITDHFPLSYNPGNCDYDKSLISDVTVWHQVFVHHNRGYNREQILEALFRFIPENDFYPVAYRESKVSDYFFLRCCTKALMQLFEHNCKLPMEDHQFIDVTIKFGVAKYQQGQITQNEKVSNILKEKVQKAGDDGILNLDEFASHPSLVDISMNLSNTACFRMICHKINGMDAVRAKIRKISLANNELRNLEPFSDFNKIKLKVLDLRNNHILDFLKIKYLRSLDLEELHLEGNPVTKLPRFHEILKENLPTLRKVDGYDYAPQLRPTYERETVSAPLRSLAGKYRWKNGNEKLGFIGDGDLIKSNDINALSIDKFKQYNRRDVWHQVVLYHHGKFEKETLLKALLEIVGEHSFYPCYYKKYAKQDEFFLFNCFDSLERLVRNAKLILKINGTLVNIVLKMNVSEFKEDQINYYEKINYVLAGRFNEGVLDLSDFRNDVEFSQIYVPLNTQQSIGNVLKWASHQFPNIMKIDLQKNEIKQCVGLMHLSSSSLSRLKALDLRWNNIDCVEDFSGMALIHKITEVNLDGNPICKAYSTKPNEFIKDLKQVFSDLEYMDGVKVKRDLPFITRQNYLCSPNYYTMVENFVQHFFQLYDSPQRNLLKEMYSDESIFTLSCYFQCERLQNANIIPRVRTYANVSRNVLKMSDYLSQCSTNLLYGAEKIGAFFNHLPQTEHDLLSFTIDVPMTEAHMTMIIISGVFREKASSLLDPDFSFGFTRTFLLKPYQKGEGVFNKSYEYKIYNEQLHIHNATIAQKEFSFKNTISNDDLDNRHRELMPTDFETKEAKLLLFKELTELNRSWCTKLLEEARYDIKVALTLFISCNEKDVFKEADFE